eukprot:scaffold714_cov121-Isochrysis_galbana.AAC.12
MPIRAVEIDELETARRVVDDGSSFPLQTAWARDGGTTGGACGPGGGMAGATAGAGGTTGVVVIGDDGCAGSANAKCVGTGDSAGDSVGPLVAAPVKAVVVDQIKAARRVMEEGSSFPLQTAWRDRVGSKGWGTTTKAWGWGGLAAGAAATAAMTGRAKTVRRGVERGTRAGGTTAAKAGRPEAAGK